MRKNFTDAELEKEVRRAKRFIDISFAITTLLTFIGILSYVLWIK